MLRSEPCDERSMVGAVGFEPTTTSSQSTRGRRNRTFNPHPQRQNSQWWRAFLRFSRFWTSLRFPGHFLAMISPNCTLPMGAGQHATVVRVVPRHNLTSVRTAHTTEGRHRARS